MYTAAIIPARYQSTRFAGKPLADICGRPMIWWVYRQASMARRVNEICVATDHPEIEKVCKQYGIPCRMTSSSHQTGTERLYEISQQLSADVYVCINGDEPLVEPSLIERVIPASKENFFAANLMAEMKNPAEVVDETNIKVVADADGRALFFSRSPIPHPKASLAFQYYKHLGILAYSPQALHFFAHTPRGKLESIEDVNELRFIEHGKPLTMIPVQAESLSVDTPKDLAYVRAVIRQKLEKGEIKL